jgi:hypothetical protein
MAYAADITWFVEEPAPGRRRISIYVIETDCAAGSAWSTDPGTAGVTINKASNVENDPKNGQFIPIPPSFTIRNFKQELVSGSATTVNGMLGCPSTPGSFTDDTMDLLYHVDAAAAFIHEASVSTVAFPPDRKKRILSGMSRPSAGSDNEVHTHIILEGGL